MGTLIGPFAQVLTMEGTNPSGPLKDSDLEIIEGGGIVVDRGQIVRVVRYVDLDEFSGNRIEFESPCVAMPGFIDCHTHICFAGSRAAEYAMRLNGATYQQIAAGGGGILSTVKKTRAATLEELSGQVVRHARMMLEWGVTTAEVKSGYGLTIESEVKMLKAIQNASLSQAVSLIPTCLAAHTLPPEYRNRSDYLNHLAEALFPRLLQEELTRRIDIFVEEGAFSTDEARNYLLKAQDKGFDVVIHGDQFSVGGSLLASELKALSVDHCEQIEFEQAKLLKDQGVIPVALPGASIGLGMKFAPARMLLDEGLPLVIASDWNPGSAPMGNLLVQAAILSAFEKLTMAETFAAMTTRAAKALRLADRGSLRPGQRADFIIFPTADYREILYRQGALRPSCVYIEGEPVYAV